MPEIGDIKWGSEIGMISPSKRRFIWVACAVCKKERWVRLRKKKPLYPRCNSCANRDTLKTGAANPFWKGGKIKSHDGYMRILVQPDDFFFPMANNCYILEHRFVMAQHLNRCLLPWEIVHHKNGIKDDNRLENLQLLPNRTHHIGDSLLKQRIKRLETKVEEQAKLIKLLQWQIKEAGGLAESIQEAHNAGE